jgi:hypothetical protein
MILSISEIGLFDWIFAFFWGILLLTFIISIPSVVAAFKIGFKDYINQFRILRLMLKKVSIGYKIIENQTYSFKGLGYNGPKTIVKVETKHYFPIIINKDIVAVISKTEGPFNIIDIQYCENKNNKWSNDLMVIKTSTCLFTQILNDKLQKKIDSLMKDSVKIDEIQNLNQLLNSQIVSIKREEVLNTILNG